MFLELTADGAGRTRDLVAEANHRIANSLAAVAALVHQQATSISREREALPPQKVVRILSEVRGRVDAIARLHRALSDAPADAPIDIGAYLQPIVTGLASSLAEPAKLRLHFACELGCRAAPERALHLGQIVVELVTNAIKYAHPSGVPGQIDVLCRRDPGGILIEVTDDGVGLPEGFDPTHATSSGMRLMLALAAQIGGSLTFESRGLGLRVTARAPAALAV